MPSKSYTITELVYTLQGEGKLAGTPMVLVRFGGCNLACRRDREGFDCDTPLAHTTGDPYTGEALLRAIEREAQRHPGLLCQPRWVLLTGGEPALQVDDTLVQQLIEAGYHVAMETNGTLPVPGNLDWVTVSPKPFASLMVRTCSEVKYVLRAGEFPYAVWNNGLMADHVLISPAFNMDGTVDAETLAWCVNLVKGDPTLCLSVQMHKLIRIP